VRRDVVAREAAGYPVPFRFSVVADDGKDQAERLEPLQIRGRPRDAPMTAILGASAPASGGSRRDRDLADVVDDPRPASATISSPKAETRASFAAKDREALAVASCRDPCLDADREGEEDGLGPLQLVGVALDRAASHAATISIRSTGFEREVVRARSIPFIRFSTALDDVTMMTGSAGSRDPP